MENVVAVGSGCQQPMVGSVIKESSKSCNGVRATLYLSKQGTKVARSRGPIGDRHREGSSFLIVMWDIAKSTGSLRPWATMHHTYRKRCASQVAAGEWSELMV